MSSHAAWRKVLKDLITFYREMQTQYDHKAKSLLKVSNAISTPTAPSPFMASGVVDEALQIMRNYHKLAIAEATKSRDIENDVILALVGLRSDLSQKIKEIKSLSGDFKNSVEKEMESTRRVVHALQDGLGQSDIDPHQGVGKQDPYLLKLAVDRQVEKQIDEENYLHQVSDWLLRLPSSSHFTDRSRHISTWRLLGESWKPLSLVRSRSHITLMLESSSARATQHTLQSKTCARAQLPCQRTTSGTRS